MPLYSYKCKACDHVFEVRQRFSDDPLTECPQCSGEVRRVISPVGVVFKGSGFYVTDNRNGKSAVSTSTSSNSTSSSDSDTSDKSGSSTSNSVSTAKKTEVSTSSAASSAA